MSTVEKLQAARDYLLEHGWFKGWSQNSQGEVCAGGALKAVTCGFQTETIWDDVPGMSFLSSAALELGIPEDAPRRACGPVTKFNDAPSTTFNDVMALFDEAILLAKEAEANAA